MHNLRDGCHGTIACFHCEGATVDDHYMAGLLDTANSRSLIQSSFQSFLNRKQVQFVTRQPSDQKPKLDAREPQRERVVECFRKVEVESRECARLFQNESTTESS